MRNLSKIAIAIISLTLFNAWTTAPKNDLKKAKWLIGTWENKTSKGSVFETWCKKSKAEYAGKSYQLKQNDTVVLENVRLVQEGSNLFYIPTVTDQNRGLPVRFTSTKVSATQLVFENMQHDFPQVIAYTKVTSDSLVAVISGTKNGKKRSQMFAMKRVK